MSPTRTLPAPRAGDSTAVTDGPGRWRFQFNRLPPSENSHHVPTEGAERALSRDTIAWRKQCGDLKRLVRWEASADRLYIVHMWFTMPRWGMDGQNLEKEVFDGLIGKRLDHRVIYHSARKQVQRGVERTTVRIIELRQETA